MNSMVNGERLDVRIVTSTAADSYALGYSEAEFRCLKFQGEYLADTLRSLLPMAERAGVATAAEIAIETMAERLRKEAVENNACIMPPPLVGAWTRAPAATGIAIGYR
jgi:hypothetical protein